MTHIVTEISKYLPQKKLWTVKIWLPMVLPEGVLDQRRSKWPRRPSWSKCLCSEPEFSIHDSKVDHNGPFWSEEVKSGPFGSANCTVATPDSDD